MPIFILWGIIILDLIIPLIPVTAVFLIYVLMMKPAFFKKWIEAIYTHQAGEKV